MKRKKKERQDLLKVTLEENPFMTDEDLADQFSVSIQTIRLDRLELAIPELRERIKGVAKKQLDDVKALSPEEVIGEIVDLQLDERAISILDVRTEHVFTRSGIARGHHLFAQANSLAVAIIDDEMALTQKATIRFTRQVQAGERVIAKANITGIEKGRTSVEVKSYVDQELVFSGEFVMFRTTERETRRRES
ncbi:transcription factor FapR [Alkalihalobacillus sp. MEB130]|uniref:transcription factor FapR n=1 Tax=Alkalihalobacillus sp. MEB130 TaxID=2976704 RepID=UPI0028DDD02D|nr:transcription factor FapR [Alkalihalobacillus sp. MEB130]MDT8859064.1 transcription factor FapR [Alkalihalobacillus sp. MEB130]